MPTDPSLCTRLYLALSLVDCPPEMSHLPIKMLFVGKPELGD